MALRALKKTERERLVDLFFRLKTLGVQYPAAREEIMTALRCLKAVHSNALENRSVDRIFLQILIHNAGIPDKSKISPAYQKASLELRGQEEMLRKTEERSLKKEELSISLLLDMHRTIFAQSWPDIAGRFRDSDVEIQGMAHLPPPAPRVQGMLQQTFMSINEALLSMGELTPKNFFEVLRLSAKAHYLIAHVHPFRDGNGRMARAMGDFVMLYFGMFHDVVMKDYRDDYLDALEECDITDAAPLFNFLQYSYLETLERISTFFKLLKQ